MRYTSKMLLHTVMLPATVGSTGHCEWKFELNLNLIEFETGPAADQAHSGCSLQTLSMRQPAYLGAVRACCYVWAECRRLLDAPHCLVRGCFNDNCLWGER